MVGLQARVYAFAGGHRDDWVDNQSVIRYWDNFIRFYGQVTTVPALDTTCNRTGISNHVNKIALLMSLMPKSKRRGI